MNICSKRHFKSRYAIFKSYLDLFRNKNLDINLRNHSSYNMYLNQLQALDPFKTLEKMLLPFYFEENEVLFCSIWGS